MNFKSFFERYCQKNPEGIVKKFYEEIPEKKILETLFSGIVDHIPKECFEASSKGIAEKILNKTTAELSKSITGVFTFQSSEKFIRIAEGINKRILMERNYRKILKKILTELRLKKFLKHF